MGLRKVYVIGRLARISTYDHSSEQKDRGVRHRYSSVQAREWFSFRERRREPGFRIEDWHLKVFGTLQEAEDYVAHSQSRDVDRWGFTYLTGRASAIFHVNVTETAHLPTIHCYTHHPHVCDSLSPIYGHDPSGYSQYGPLYNVLDLNPRDIVSMECATFNHDRLHVLINPEMKNIDLRPQQQSKYEKIAESASNWRVVCHNMIRVYRGNWYNLPRAHRHLATEIEMSLNSHSTTDFDLDTLLSRLQQRVPKKSWDHDFYGMITAMRVMLNMGFKRELLKDRLPIAGIADLVLQYTGDRIPKEKRGAEESVDSDRVLTVSAPAAFFNSKTSTSPSPVVALSSLKFKA